MKGVTNNPNGRPKGSINKKRQHFFDMAEKHGLDIAEAWILIWLGKSEELGWCDPNDIDPDTGKPAKVIIPAEMRLLALSTLTKHMIAPARHVPEVDPDEAGKDAESNIVRLVYNFDTPPKKIEEEK